MRCKSKQPPAVPQTALQHACSVRGACHGVGCCRQGTGNRKCLEVTPWLRSERCTKAQQLMSAHLSPLAVLFPDDSALRNAHSLTQEQRTSADARKAPQDQRATTHVGSLTREVCMKCWRRALRRNGHRRGGQPRAGENPRSNTTKADWA